MDGQVCVYLLDEITQNVFCILPYKSDLGSAYYIEANKDYVLFSKKDANQFERFIVDEYTLNCEYEKEFSTLYILFSPTNIGKENGFYEIDEDKPYSVHYREFKKWLSSVLSKDDNIQFQEIKLTISK